ncbi:MAG: lamin tail domain-containing protein, partial [Verrucomicrobiae bacterium]|nr:lamin tail domain-containing protein [Verrucomicrobiae bacterium]
APEPLNGVSFTRAIGYTFSGTDPLAPGQRIVIARDRPKFLARYGSGFRLAPDVFSGGFSADGERVTIADANGQVILDFTYGVSNPWPSRPDGFGSTLECVDPSGNLNDPKNWRPSSEWLGSPGRPGFGPQRRVAINEILAHTDPPYEDAIEFLNLTDEAVPLDGWYLSNQRAAPTKYRIPANTVLEPRGRLVFYEYQFDPDVPAPGQAAFRFNSAHGDEAVLMSADASGRPEYWMDVVSFGATANGVSLGRFPEGTGPLVPMSRQTFGTLISPTMPAEYLAEFRTGRGGTNSGPLVGPVVVRRIQYFPGAGGDEFIELESIHPLTVPLFDPNAPTNTWRIRGGADFNLPEGISLEPSARLMVVGTDPEAFRARHQVPASIPVLGPWTGSLEDVGDHVVLYKPDTPQSEDHPDAGFVPYVLVEEVEFSPEAPWPVEAAGSGPALLRKDLTAFGNDPANWTVDSLLPPVAPVLEIGVEGGVIRLRFESAAGRTYRLQSRTLVPGDSWTELGLIPTPSAGGSVVLDVPSTGAARLLRVLVE